MRRSLAVQPVYDADRHGLCAYGGCPAYDGVADRCRVTGLVRHPGYIYICEPWARALLLPPSPDEELTLLPLVGGAA